MLIFVSIALGLVVGSFLNVVINRLKNGEGLNGRSHCPHCKHQLEAIDLFPVLSYVFLRGKCRHCGVRISVQYPLVEALTALTFTLVALKAQNFDYLLVFEWVLAAFFIVVAVYDYKHFLILDKLVFPGLAVAFFYVLLQDFLGPCGSWQCSATISGFLGALLISGFFYLQHIVSQGRWIGFGDVKYGLLLGMTVGFSSSILLVFIAYMAGALVGVVLIAVGGKKMSSKLPFGTFLSFAAIITLLYGEAILTWYKELIGL